MTRQPKFRCFVCEQELQENAGIFTCTFCGQQEPGEWACPGGHYMCEECRLSTPGEAIIRVCSHTTSSNAWEIAALVMRHPSFKPHGLEHHLVVAPVVLTALANSGRIEFDRNDRKKLAAALKRTIDIPFGVCGSRGDCGACVGAGAAVSIMLKAGFASGKERSLTLKATAAALLRLAETGGPRCCKQSVYAALETCSLVFKNELNLDLEIGDKKCLFSSKITDCKKEICPYY